MVQMLIKLRSVPLLSEFDVQGSYDHILYNIFS